MLDFFNVIQLQNVFAVSSFFFNDSSFGNAETPQICKLVSKSRIVPVAQW